MNGSQSVVVGGSRSKLSSSATSSTGQRETSTSLVGLLAYVVWTACTRVTSSELSEVPMPTYTRTERDR